MDVDSSQQRMAAYMRDHQDKVVGRWSEIVVAGLRGRSSVAEVRRELEDLYSLVVRAMSGADEQVAGELTAVLTELSGSRARHGFTPRETAPGVFALKDAVFQLVADVADLAPEYLAYSRMIDDLGLLTFETYAAAREQIIADQATAMLELSTPVIRLWDGVIAVPLVGAHSAGHGEAAGDPGRDRRGSRRAGHHRGVHGRHRGGPASAQDGERGAPARGRVHRQRHPAAGRADDRVARHRVRRHRHQGDAGRRAGARAEPSRPAHRPAAPRPAASRAPEAGPRLMDRVPILKIGTTLFVSIQIDLQDESVVRLQEDLADELAATGARGVIIDITAVEIVDSFIGRMLAMIGSISRLFDAETVLVGMRPAVAITLTELGLSLRGVRTALNAEKGLELLNGRA